MSYQQPNSQPFGYPPTPEQYQQPPQPQKRPMPAWAIIGICCLLLAAYAGIATLLKSNTQPASSDASTSSSVSSSATWTTTHTFSGTTRENTAPITINSGQWKLNWSCQGFSSDGVDGALGIILRNPQNNQPIDVPVNASCKVGNASTGSTYDYTNGTFYLEINSAGDGWSAQIQELQ